MLPESIELRPAIIIAISPEWTESLTRRTAYDEISVRILRSTCDVSIEHLTPEVTGERRCSRTLMLNSKYRQKA